MSVNPPSIFLSHSHEDKAFARRLAGDLVDRGVSVWIDEAEIKLGDSLIQKVSGAIDSVDYLAVVLTPRSVRSEWVQRELEIALTQEIAGQTVKVLPLLVLECELPAFLTGRLYADFTSPDRYENGLNMILDRVGLYREKRPRQVAERLPAGEVDALLSTDALRRESERRA